jgi:hypothetical protein
MNQMFCISLILIINLSYTNNSYSQSFKNNLNNISESNKKIVCLEYNDYPKGVSTLGLAKVTVYDLQNNIKFDFTDDRSFNKDPSFSSDGKRILFFSSRNVSSNIVEILGSSAQNDIFNLDISRNEIMLFPQLNILNKELELGHSIEKIEQINDSIFIVSTFSSIRSFNIKNNIVITEKMLNDNSDQSIYDFCATNNNVVVRYHIKNSGNNNIVLLNRSSKKEILISEDYHIDLGNWSPDGRYFCYIDSVINIYDVSKSEVKDVKTDELKSKGIGCEHAYFISNHEMILLGWEIDKKTNRQKDDFYLINLDNNQISQLTNDGNTKEDISVYYKE